jgi:hypothetical protein
MLTDEWHQYDGVANPPDNPGIAQRISDFFQGSFKKRLKHDADVSANAFLPTWEGFRPGSGDHSGTAQDAMDQVEAVLRGLKRVYQTDGRLWDGDEEATSSVSIWLWVGPRSLPSSLPSLCLPMSLGACAIYQAVLVMVITFYLYRFRHSFSVSSI